MGMEEMKMAEGSERVRMQTSSSETTELFLDLVQCSDRPAVGTTGLPLYQELLQGSEILLFENRLAIPLRVMCGYGTRQVSEFFSEPKGQ